MEYGPTTLNMDSSSYKSFLLFSRSSAAASFFGYFDFDSKRSRGVVLGDSLMRPSN